eukprot:TRINITY_DN41734_c0_g1_i1.p1 TRINITY_DN41734_c0_g1~~TRINITY_DN41734_c0_g1_i1.p1  ORF type:complete len:340 (+),score=89.02 TRINITY_DN41734_c0_g1_i1:78-1022(+)
MGSSLTVPRIECNCQEETEVIEEVVAPVSAYATGEVDAGHASKAGESLTETVSTSASSEDDDSIQTAVPLWRQEVELQIQNRLDAEEEQARQREKEAQMAADAAEAEAQKKAEAKAALKSKAKPSSSKKKASSQPKAARTLEPESAGEQTQEEVPPPKPSQEQVVPESRGSVADTLPDDVNEWTQAQMVSLCNEALVATKAQASNLYIMDNGKLTIKASYAKPKYTAFSNESQEFKFAPGVGLPGRTFNSKRPGLLPDVRETDIVNFPRKQLALDYNLVCFSVKPVGRNAVLEVVSKKKWDKIPAYMKQFKRVS